MLSTVGTTYLDLKGLDGLAKIGPGDPSLQGACCTPSDPDAIFCTTYLDLKGLDGLAQLCLETLLIKALARCSGGAGQLLLPGINPT
jgi:hypothetical protein